VSNINWRFPPNGGGQCDGFTDAGIENFTGNRIESLGREIIQNSLDAKDSSAGDKPVIVTFNVKRIKAENFPGLDELKVSMQACLDQLRSDDQRESDFFKAAIAILEKPHIPILRIDDYYTNGLRYDFEVPRHSPFFAITKGKGISNKASDTAGGSYGIGQSAPYASSDLRTVFYSTEYSEEVNEIKLLQGKSILMSHTVSGEMTLGTGYYGQVDGCGPVVSDIPSDFQRHSPSGLSRQGTSVFVTGFNGHGDWKNRLIAAILGSYFFAIKEKKLIVRIDNDIEISHKTLSSYFYDEDKVQQLTDREGGGGHRDPYLRARQYFSALEQPTITKDKQMNGLGHGQLWIRVQDDDEDESESLDKSVALLRDTGMLITDEHNRLRRFTGYKNFSGVFVCRGDAGNKLLREMEPPRHDAFEPDRLRTQQEKRKAKAALKEMEDWIRNVAKEVAMAPVEERTEVEQLREFLPDPDPDEQLPGEGGETDIEGEPILTTRPIRRPPVVNIQIGEDTDEDEDEGEAGVGTGSGESSGDDGDGSGEGGGSSSGEKGGGQSQVTIGIRDIRVLSHDSRNKTLYFTPQSDGCINLEIQEMGDAPGPRIRVVNTNQGQLNGGRIESLNVKANERVAINVAYESDYENSVRVLAYAV
jgi:hypothetical protein